ncbi:hypothetical protein E6W39_05605 [Kitasatospora acidiphila]|uniref:PEGA domain-containing protein n=1 Tax=Kitasatospora acidiphila TaxID=2567942 RepID=A0A540VYJ0_9ACTN|nr:hypothetical protein [Kitasatospora acidiphila]TQF01829.1 hypothetical protein E6W39_05605 [Kitasatospora acidiphila]
MNGTIAVYAEPPGIGRAGKFWVIIDGVRVGRVRQGDAMRFAVAAGTHTVRVGSGDRTTRSNTVTVAVAEGGESLVTARSTGLKFALIVPFLAGVVVPRVYVLGFVVLLAAVFAAVPGVLFRVAVQGLPEPSPVGPPAPPAADGEPAAVEAAVGETAAVGGSGLWWESDPALAKRYRKTADS